jgi:hypothetical protein
VSRLAPHERTPAIVYADHPRIKTVVLMRAILRASFSTICHRPPSLAVGLALHDRCALVELLLAANDGHGDFH